MKTPAQIRAHVRELEEKRTAVMNAAAEGYQAEVARLNGRIEEANAMLDAAIEASTAETGITAGPAPTQGESFFRNLSGSFVDIATMPAIMSPNAAMTTDAAPGSMLVTEEWAAQYREARLSGHPWATKVDRVVTTTTHNIPYVVDVGAFVDTDEGVDYAEDSDEIEPIVLGALKATRKTTVSEELLEDTAYDLDGMLAVNSGKGAARYEFAKIVAAPTAETANVTLTNKSSIVLADITKMYFTIGEEYRDDLCWLMNPETAEHMATILDAEGRPLFRPAADGAPATFYGLPYVTSDAVAGLGTANNKALVLCNPGMIVVADRGKLRAKKMETESGMKYLFALRQDRKLAPVSAFAIAKCGTTDPTP